MGTAATSGPTRTCRRGPRDTRRCRRPAQTTGVEPALRDLAPRRERRPYGDMQQTGEHRIAAPRARVWEALNDPEVLKRCIDGCEDLARTGDNAYQAVVRARLG